MKSRLGIVVILALALALAGGAAHAGSVSGANGMLAFVRDDSSNDAQIWIANADGTGEVQVTTDATQHFDPRWSPDGTELAYTSYPDPANLANADIYVVPVSSSGATGAAVQLTTSSAGDSNPAWSPDGAEIAWSSGCNIWTMASDGSSKTQLTHASSSSLCDVMPAWSPDGTEIAYGHQVSGGDYDILETTPDGATTRTILSTSAFESDPAWSPDGTTIAFDHATSASSGDDDVYTVPVAGGTATPIAATSAFETMPTWSPDGTEIAYSSGSDVAVVPAYGGTPTVVEHGAFNPEPDWQAVAASSGGGGGSGGSGGSSGAAGALVQLAAPNDCIAETAAVGCGATGSGLEGADWIAISPDGKDVYVASFGASAVAEFARNSDGSLTELGCIATTGSGECPTTTAGLGYATSVTVSPDGQNVYVTGSEDNTLVVFDRNADGTLTPAQCLQDAASTYDRCATKVVGLRNAYDVTVSPDGSNVYVAAGGFGSVGGEIGEFTRAADGTLTQLAAPDDCVEEQGDATPVCGTSTGKGLTAATALAVTPDGSHLYAVSDDSPGAVAEFARNGDGSLTQLTGADACIGPSNSTECTPVTNAMSDLVNLAISPDGSTLYTASDVGAGPIGRFTIGSGGSLSAATCVASYTGLCSGGTVAGTNAAFGLGLSPDGTNLYVAAAGSSSLGKPAAVSSFDVSGAGIDQLSSPDDCTQAAGASICGRTGTGLADALGVVVSPDGANAYAVSSTATDGAIVSFARGATSSGGSGGGGGGGGGGSAPSAITVTRFDDPAGAGSCPTDCSLRQALAAIAAGGTVTLPAGEYDLTQDELSTSQSTALVGAGDGVTTIRQQTADRRVLEVTSGTLSVSGVTITGGDSVYDGTGDASPGQGGGALVDPGASLALDRVSVSDNHADGYGGGIFDRGSLTVSSSSVVGNSADTDSYAQGAGIAYSGSSLTVTSTLISGNVGVDGGGVYVSRGGTAASLVNDTIVDNRASRSGGGIEADPAGVTAVVTNSILAANAGGNCSGSVISGGHNISSDVDCSFLEATDHWNSDPSLGTGGVPEPGSEAIDAGDDAACAAVDRDGVTRPQGTHCDIGAFEAAAVVIPTQPGPGAPSSLTVTRLDDPAGAGRCPLDCSLRQALASVAAGGSVVLPAGTYDLTQGQLVLGWDVTITGDGAGSTEIAQDGSHRVAEIAAGTVALRDVTITGGASPFPGADPSSGDGGGILVDHGATFALRNATVSGNSADLAGGGIAVEGTATIDRSTLDGNTTHGDGGGLFVAGRATATITSSLLATNHADGNGGGVEGAATLLNDTVASNAAADGGGIADGASIQNSILDGNTGGNCGGGYSDGGHNLTSDGCALGASGDQPNTSARLDSTYALTAASPAVDAGADGVCPSLDRAGVARPQGAHCDIGAFELVPGTVQPQVVTVSSGAAAVSLPPLAAAPKPDFTWTGTRAGSGTAFTATVTQPGNVPVSDYSWDFGDGSSGTGSPAEHAYAAAGTYVVELTVRNAQGTTATVSHPVAIHAGTAAVTVAPAVVPADGKSFATIAVRLRTPLAGTSVVLEPLGGSSSARLESGTLVRKGLPASAATTAAGSVAWTVSDSSVEDVAYQVVLPDLGLRFDIAVSFVPATPIGASKLVATPHSIPADGRTQATVTLTLRDDHGKPLPQRAVRLLPVDAAGRPTHAIAAPGKAVTKADGSATFQVTDLWPEAVRMRVLDATDGYVVVPSTNAAWTAATVTFTVVRPASASRSTLVSTIAKAPTFGPPYPKLTLTLRDAKGVPVPNRTVHFTVNGAAKLTSAASAVTDDDGTATVTLSDTTQQTVKVTATSKTDGISVAANVAFLDHSIDSAHSTVDSPAQGVADGVAPATITVKLVDQLGQPYGGATVYLHPQGGHSKLAAASTKADANGVATFVVTDSTVEWVTYTANAQQGSSIVPISGSTAVDFMTPAPDPAHSTLVVHLDDCLCGTSQVGPQPHTITVTVRDAANVPLVGVPLLVFDQDPGQDGPVTNLTPSATTDANGVAVFHATLDEPYPGTSVAYSLAAKTVRGDEIVVATEAWSSVWP